MSEWRKTKFSDVLIDESISYGIVQPGPHSEINSVPILRVNNIKNGRIKTDDVLRVDSEIEQKYQRTRLTGGELLITVVGSIGECAIVPNKLRGWNVARAVSVARIKNTFESRFIKYCFKSDNVIFQMYGNTNDTVQPTLNLSSLKNLTLLIPSLSEQKTIASILGSIDEKVDLLQRQNKTLESMTEALFRQWFVEESQDDWAHKKLSDFIRIKHGYAFKGEFITSDVTNQILVTPGNFKIGGGFKFDKFKYLKKCNYPVEYMFAPDDLVVTMTDLSKDGDTLGYPAIIPIHNNNEITYLHNQRVGKIELKSDELSKIFLYFLMRTPEYQWFVLGGSTGTSVKHTSPTLICNYRFLMPPHKKLADFDSVAESLISKVQINDAQIRKLETLRDTLLPKLMTGEVRVN